MRPGDLISFRLLSLLNLHQLAQCPRRSLVHKPMEIKLKTLHSHDIIGKTQHLMKACPSIISNTPKAHIPPMSEMRAPRRSDGTINLGMLQSKPTHLVLSLSRCGQGRIYFEPPVMMAEAREAVLLAKGDDP